MLEWPAARRSQGKFSLKMSNFRLKFGWCRLRPALESNDRNRWNGSLGSIQIPIPTLPKNTDFRSRFRTDSDCSPALMPTAQLVVVVSFGSRQALSRGQVTFKVKAERLFGARNTSLQPDL